MTSAELWPEGLHLRLAVKPKAIPELGAWTPGSHFLAAIIFDRGAGRQVEKVALGSNFRVYRKRKLIRAFDMMVNFRRPAPP